MRKPAIVATALAAALALGGCTAQSGAAAIVDGQPIATTTLDRTTRELNQLFAIDSRGVLSLFIVAPISLDEARGLGIGKSHDEARAFLAGHAAANEVDLDVDAISPATLDIVASDSALAQMGQLVDAGPVIARINERLAALDVDVNPRFGEFNGSTVAPTTPEWIVSAPTS